MERPIIFTLTERFPVYLFSSLYYPDTECLISLFVPMTLKFWGVLKFFSKIVVCFMGLKSLTGYHMPSHLVDQNAEFLEYDF